jgi:hypothetical protein
MNPRNVFHKAVESLEDYWVASRIAAWTALQIRLAQKFIVPDAGQMTDGKPYDNFKESMRLPFDRVALLRDVDIGAGRIVQQIVVASSAKVAGVPNEDGQHDFVVGACVCVDQAQGAWAPEAPRCISLNRIGGGIQIFDLPDAQEEEIAMYGQRIFSRDGGAYGPLNGLAELLVMLSLDNVKTSRVAAPSFLNKKRERKGKVPLYDYHVLTIDGQDVYDRNGAGESDRTIRSHFRRGHIRRIDESRRVWVRQAYVHGRSDGFLDKDYRVESRV